MSNENTGQPGSTPDRDAATGLYNRKGFVHEVQQIQHSMPNRLRCGCVLIIQFPVLRKLHDTDDDDNTVNDALRHLIAILETRVRSRDTLARIAPYSLGIFLKQCRATDAAIVSEQFVALLRHLVVQAGGQQLPMDLRYRIISLDKPKKRGHKEALKSNGTARLVAPFPSGEGTRLLKTVQVSGNAVDLSSSRVISLSDVRSNRSESSADDARPEVAAKSVVVQVGARDQVASWRLRPGILLQRKSLVCCFRLQPVGVPDSNVPLQGTDVFASVLNALSLGPQAARPIIESQLIIPVQSSQLNEHFGAWVTRHCQRMRVAPSDICLSLGVDSLAADLPAAAPVLRQLNRHGIRLMLESVQSSDQLRMLRNLANFDYLFIDSRALNVSMTQLNKRVVLQGMIQEARDLHCEICAGGVDTAAHLQHAAGLGVEIGFGKACGASEPFPVQAWQDVLPAGDDNIE